MDCGDLVIFGVFAENETNVLIRNKLRLKSGCTSQKLLKAQLCVTSGSHMTSVLVSTQY